MNTTFMTRAIELSRLHMRANAGGPFGALVVKDGKVIGEGWNQVTSSNDPTAHAEVVAIRDACRALNTFTLEGAEIYASCEPCPMCLAAIYWARIGKVYYANTRQDAAAIGFDDDFLYQEIAKDVAERKVPMLQAARDEALAVFEEWMVKNDKRPY
ncbi:MAG: nucleoside deaminase [Pseudomonadales bacterium]|jgi:tRNA(Arg) A34 adenosine deaminase TadA|nr:nucleoside deaminase [Pseudomonadales bacterium]